MRLCLGPGARNLTLGLDLLSDALQLDDSIKASVKPLNIVAIEALAVFEKFEIELCMFARLNRLVRALFPQLRAQLAHVLLHGKMAGPEQALLTLLSCFRKREFKRLWALHRRVSTSVEREYRKSHRET